MSKKNKSRANLKAFRGANFILSKILSYTDNDPEIKDYYQRDPMIVCRHYHKKHPMCGDSPPKNLPDSMKRFWKTQVLGESEYAVVAYDNGKIIGFFKYYLTRSKRMNAYGTYVMPAYRKLGVAKRLWNLAIKKINPKKIRVYLTTKNGKKFLDSMVKEHNKIEFLIRGK